MHEKSIGKDQTKNNTTNFSLAAAVRNQRPNPGEKIENIFSLDISSGLFPPKHAQALIL